MCFPKPNFQNPYRPNDETVDRIRKSYGEAKIVRAEKFDVFFVRRAIWTVKFVDAVSLLVLQN